jgi:hypothetical protein
MSWVRTDDGAPLHPKFFRAGVSAYGWWHAGLSYCNRLLTDGFIPTSDIELVFPGTPRDEVVAHIEVLVREGSLKIGRRKGRDGYVIHDYHDHQPHSSVVLERRRSLSTIGRKGGVKSGETRKRGASPELNHDASTPSKQDPKPRPDPSRPDPSRPDPSRPDLKDIAPRSQRAAPDPVSTTESMTALHAVQHVPADFEKFYAMYPRKVGPDAALKAWKAAVRKATPSDILAGLERQMPALRAQETTFVPHPATWLNQGRWKDEPSTPASPAPPQRSKDTWAGVKPGTRRHADGLGPAVHDGVSLQ